MDIAEEDELPIIQPQNYGRDNMERLGGKNANKHDKNLLFILALSPATDLSFGLGSLVFTNKKRNENHGK